MTRIFYSTWVKPACCVSKISSDGGCQSKETGVGMEVRFLSVGARGFFLAASRLSFAASPLNVLSPPTRKKPLAPRVSSREIWTQKIDLAPNVWLHSSVRESYWYRRGHGFSSRWNLDFFLLLRSNCLNWKIYCDDHSSLWSTTAVQIYELFHIYFTSVFSFWF